MKYKCSNVQHRMDNTISHNNLKIEEFLSFVFFYLFVCLFAWFVALLFGDFGVLRAICPNGKTLFHLHLSHTIYTLCLNVILGCATPSNAHDFQ